MNGNRVFGLPIVPLLHTDTVCLSYLRSHVYMNLTQCLFWEYSQSYSKCIYKIDKALSSEATFDTTARKVSRLFDHTLYANLANQSTSNNRPTLCTSANRNNNSYYGNFNGTQ